MKSFNNELTIQRGESFSIDRTIRNKDGSPYIISSILQNPYLVIAVSTTRYMQKDRYLINYWLKADNLRRFVATVPFDLLTLTTEANGEVSKYPNGFTDITSLQDGYVATGYIGDTLVMLEPGDCVFFVGDEPVYKYWDIDKSAWKDYQFRFVKSFRKEDTSKWTEQSYVYSINLVDGMSTDAYIDYLMTQNALPILPDDMLEDKYNKLLEVGVVFDEDFDITSPLVRIDVSMPILQPTKMSVLSSINGGRI